MPSTGGHRWRHVDEREREHLALAASVRRRQLGLDGAQSRQSLLQGIGGDEPAEALPGIHQALVAQHVERLADRHSTRLVGPRQLGLARQYPPRPEVPGGHLGSNGIGDLAVAHRSSRAGGIMHGQLVADLYSHDNLYYSCLQEPDPPTTCHPRQETARTRDGSAPTRGTSWLFKRPPRSNSSTASTPPSTSASAPPASGSDAPSPSPRRSWSITSTRPDQELERGDVLRRPAPRSRRHARRHRPDGVAAVHDRRPRRGPGTHHHPLRSPHPGPRGRQDATCSPPSTPTRRSTTSSRP